MYTLLIMCIKIRWMYASGISSTPDQRIYRHAFVSNELIFVFMDCVIVAMMRSLLDPRQVNAVEVFQRVAAHQVKRGHVKHRRQDKDTPCQLPLLLQIGRAS